MGEYTDVILTVLLMLFGFITSEYDLQWGMKTSLFEVWIQMVHCLNGIQQ